MRVTAVSLLKWSETTKTRNEEQPWNATKMSPSEMIHANVEGLFQHLSTAFVAATGKRHWSKTSQSDQTLCHNSTSSFELASCLSFSQDVVTTRRNHSSLTNAYEIPNICKCSEHSQNNTKYCYILDAQHLGGLFPRLGIPSQDVARRTSNSLPEPPGTRTKASQDEQQPPRKNQTVKHNSPMMPSSCSCARWLLAFGKYGWPQ